jgi:uncharacterized protein YbjT (DUF2867 family)
MKIRAIVTGATGMVGEGVLHECLLHQDVEEVLIINRKPSGLSHAKLKEIIHKDFFDLSTIEDQLGNFNACFFCLGVSSVGMKEPTYNHLTYDLTMQMANSLVKRNPDLVFCYVSGAGTDNSENGKSMWARVKGKTENHLLRLGFRKAYMFRPGYMQPTPGLKNSLTWYKALGWAYPAFRALFPKFVCTLSELGLAMINSVTTGYEKPILEVKDIVKLAVAK